MTTILVIDDEDLVRFTLRELLESAGYSVIGAADGIHGLEAARRHNVDLVVTDIIMPRREGVETIAELRKWRSGIPVIAISGGNVDGAIPFSDSAHQAGADAGIAKPFTGDQLLDCVASLLTKRDGRNHPS